MEVEAQMVKMEDEEIVLLAVLFFLRRRNLTSGTHLLERKKVGKRLKQS